MQPLVEELVPPPPVPRALRALADLPGVALLDSPLLRPGVGRYSFLTADPVARYTVDCPEYGLDPFADVRTAMDACRAETIAGLPPFQGGVVGLLSYDLGRCFERLPATRFDEFLFPALSVGLYDWVLAWDHVAGRAWFLGRSLPEAVVPRNRLMAPNDRLADVRRRLGLSSTAHPTHRHRDHHPPVAAAQAPAAPLHPLEGHDSLWSNFSRGEYLDAVARVIEHIRAGDIFQANLAQRLLARGCDDPIALYERLRERNPAPFAGYFADDDWAILSASPERFLQVDGRDVETRPIKGTRRRRERPEADLFTRDELRESEKDRAENVMIVDLLRNDLSRVCQPGSIRVPQLCDVETYETVQHLVSAVQGRLRPDAGFWDLVAATFPGGSITGAPKIRAMQIIADIEQVARGPYCGSLFYLGFDGRADSNILIRTFLHRGGWLQCSVGGGIVAQSDPAAEYAETLHKAEGMLRALPP